MAIHFAVSLSMFYHLLNIFLHIQNSYLQAEALWIKSCTQDPFQHVFQQSDVKQQNMMIIF